MNESEQLPKYLSFQLAAHAAAGRIPAPRLVQVIIVFLAACADTAIWAPMLTGAAILWGMLVVMLYDKPVLLLVIAPIWMSFSAKPALLAWRYHFSKHRP